MEVLNSVRRSTYNSGINALKFWLMPFVCIATFGFPSEYGALIARLSLFAPLSFYILCGFAGAVGEQKEAGFHSRVLKRTILKFLLMFAIMLALNALFFAVFLDFSTFTAAFRSKRVIFNFLALCVWPFSIGDTIWFLEALVVARAVIYLMHRFGWMRYYKIVMIVSFCVTILFGELAGVIHFDILGYKYIPGNGFTRALPYMLLGRFLYEKRAKLLALPMPVYFIGIVVGIAAAYGEGELLSRTGNLVTVAHLVGYGIMALSVCCLFLNRGGDVDNFVTLHGRNYATRIYFLSQPVGHALLLIESVFSYYLGSAMPFTGIFTYVICLILAFLIGFFTFTKQKDNT